MTEAQALELISSTFATGWAAAHPDVPFALENEISTLPKPFAEEFVLLTTAFLGAKQSTHGRIGNRKVKREGWIMVKLWTAADVGMKRAAELAGSVRNILEMVALPSPLAGDDPVTTQAEVWSRRGASSEGTDGRWYMQLIRLPFWFHELK